MSQTPLGVHVMSRSGIVFEGVIQNVHIGFIIQRFESLNQILPESFWGLDRCKTSLSPWRLGVWEGG